MFSKLCSMALLCLFISITACRTANSQSVAVPTYAPGDPVPELMIYNILHHPQGKAALSSFRGRPLILNFMATWCSLCVSLLPKTDSLQQLYQGQVQFLAVTYQPEADVSKLLEKLKMRGNAITLPIAVADTVLRSLFRHQYIPHYVWIDSEGTIQAITGHEEVTPANIQQFLKTKSLALKLKNDKSLPYTKEQLLLAENRQIPNKHVLYQSAFTGFISGLPSSFTIFPVEATKPHRVVATNARIPTLFKIAYGSLQGKIFSDNTISLEMHDTTCCDSRLTGAAYSAWLSAHGYGYELIVPPSLLGQQAQIMQQDLARMFPQYVAVIEKRSFPCYALVRTSKHDKIKTRGGTAGTEVTPFGARVQNQTFIPLLFQLNAKYLAHLQKPVIDQTGYTGKADLTLTADMDNPEAIRQALAAYDLDLVVGTHEIEVLVIRDAPVKP